MTGIIEAEEGNVKVEIHTAFRVLLGLLLFFPIIGLVVSLFVDTHQFSPVLILVAIGQLLFIRYLFIGLAFKFLAQKKLESIT
tara:strand:+ start:85 stop:333 length:249 start_codon:yes stop_codon:yes gene_type:complete